MNNNIGMPRIAVKTKQEIIDAINKRKQGLQSNETKQSDAELAKAKRVSETII